MPDDDNIRPFKPKRGKPRKASELLLEHELRHNPALHSGRLFRFDTFSGDTLLMHPIPRPGVSPAKTWEVVDTTDIQLFHLMVFFQDMNFSGVNPSMVNRVVAVEADRNSFSSARERLEALPEWDGVHRLEKFFPAVCGAPVAEMGMTEAEIFKRDRYLRAVARCFFISIVARVMEPGCKVDDMLVLEGEQGIGKSTLLRVLAFDDDKWFCDTMPSDLGKKDAQELLRGRLIIEFAELIQFRTTDVNTMKGFLSTQDDKFRPSYGHRPIMLKRQCVFVGTTNSHDYLSDYTGNRRIWPVRCGEINIGLAREQMPQLYAEALEAYREDEHWWLPPDVVPIAEEEQNQRLTSDPWERKLRDLVDQRRGWAIGRGESFFWVRTDEALGATSDGGSARWDGAQRDRVRVILRKLGGKNKKLPRNNGWPGTGYHFDAAGK